MTEDGLLGLKIRSLFGWRNRVIDLLLLHSIGNVIGSSAFVFLVKGILPAGALADASCQNDGYSGSVLDQFLSKKLIVESLIKRSVVN
jgi:hypothetical protein